MKILGLSYYYHDSAVCLLVNGKPLAMAMEERFSRKKHDSGFPRLAIEFVLREAGITTKDLDYVVFYEKPFVKFKRILTTVLSGVPHTRELFRDAMLEWLPKKLWIKSELMELLGVPEGKILFCDQHVSHAASAFYPSPFKSAAIVTMDGVGEEATTTIGIGKENKIDVFKQIKFPHSIGLFYSAYTAYLGFEVNDGEYKVMGMAAFGRPKYTDRIWKTIRSLSDGSFRLNLDYFAHHYSPSRAYSEKLVRLFGPPRDPKALFFTRTTGWFSYFGDRPKDFASLAEKNQYFADIAASLQKVTEELILGVISDAMAETSQTNLCFAGGVALNSVANGLIMRKLGIKNFFIQPAAGDDGGALGAALFVYHQILGKKRKFLQEHCFYGQEYRKGEILNFIRKLPGIAYRFIPDDRRLFKEVVDRLTAKEVVGWFDGKFEWGPRALGHRSILADPRFSDIKDIVNMKIKFREPYRPFAPSVLESKASGIFNYKQAIKTDPAKFMILVSPISRSWQKKIPAVTHADGSGRLQTVDKKTNPRYYKLIEAFYRKTRVPLILNTSFNLRGEPIVNSPLDAYNTFMKSNMDVLVLGNYLITKRTNADPK